MMSFRMREEEIHSPLRRRGRDEAHLGDAGGTLEAQRLAVAVRAMPIAEAAMRLLDAR
jgi:hypothetical protein